MGLFGKSLTKEEKRMRAKYRKEKNTEFKGKALQSIGVIPKGGEVELKLNPDEQVLVINYDDEVKIKLPYSRIMGFRLECSQKVVNDNKKDIAGAVLSSGILGHGIVGTAGKIAGSMLSGQKKQKAYWIGTLIYRDKTDNIAEISFATKEEVVEGDEAQKDYYDKEFEHIVNDIAGRYNTDLNEL